jgi:hypothetical protein
MQTHKQVLSKKAFRPDAVMDRREYLTRAKEFSPHGQDLPHSKLTELDVVAIRSAARQRESLRQHIRDNLSNEALSKSFGVHVRTIEKVLQYYTWSHVA